MFGTSLAYPANEGNETKAKGNTSPVNYYKTYDRDGGTQVPVKSAKDVAEPGKVLNQDRLKVKHMTHPNQSGKRDGA